MRHRVRFHPGTPALPPLPPLRPEPELECSPPHATVKLNHTTSASNHTSRRRNIVCDVPVESLEFVTGQHLRSAGHAAVVRRVGSCYKNAIRKLATHQPEKAKFVLAQGRKRLRQYCEIMQLVLMSVRERLAPPFNRAKAEAGPSFGRASPGASPKGGIIVVQSAAAGRVGLELNSESR
jgi:hypothetical protein